MFPCELQNVAKALLFSLILFSKFSIKNSYFIYSTGAKKKKNLFFLQEINNCSTSVKKVFARVAYIVFGALV